jgi:hypothetical protein
LKERNIYVVYHSYIILLIELQKKYIIAIHSWESYYEQNPDEPKKDFWLATIICPNPPKHMVITLFIVFGLLGFGIKISII